MERWGGVGILPSGAVHLEAPTTIEDRRVEVSDLLYPRPGADQSVLDALDRLPERSYDSPTAVSRALGEEGQ